MTKILNAIVVGVGSLGQHHARVYAQNPKTQLLAVVDTDSSARLSASGKWGCQACSSIPEVQGRVDIASVVVPTESHRNVASWLINRGVSVLVEKPIAGSVEEGEALVELARSKSVILQVGHIERFNPGVLALGGYLRNPLFIESHRLGPLATRVKDVGVILDLMIHDLDLILALVNSEVKTIDAVGVPIVTQQEDIANARIRFETGCIANVTVSRVTPDRQRKIRFFQRDTYLSLDYMKPDLQVYKKNNLADGSVTIDYEHPTLKDHEPLAAEIDSFIDCVLYHQTPLVTGQDGVRALRLAEIITQQVKKVSEEILNMRDSADRS